MDLISELWYTTKKWIYSVIEAEPSQLFLWLLPLSQSAAVALEATTRGPHKHAVSCWTGGAPVCRGTAGEVQLGREAADSYLHFRWIEDVGKQRKIPCITMYSNISGYVNGKRDNGGGGL